jgi:NAD(P)-dependent dehydrogenase (short-subunit alcohol dehydrogenase family)
LKNWASGRNYCLAKLCNLLFTLELARREASHGIVAHAMHPGQADTNFATHATPEMRAYMATLEMISPEVAGRTLAWLSDSVEAGRSTGGYFFDCERLEPASQGQDVAAAAQLWRESEALLARSGF